MYSVVHGHGHGQAFSCASTHPPTHPPTLHNSPSYDAAAALVNYFPEKDIHPPTHPPTHPTYTARPMTLRLPS